MKITFRNSHVRVPDMKLSTFFFFFVNLIISKLNRFAAQLIWVFTADREYRTQSSFRLLNNNYSRKCTTIQLFLRQIQSAIIRRTFQSIKWKNIQGCIHFNWVIILLCHFVDRISCTVVSCAKDFFAFSVLFWTQNY